MGLSQAVHFQGEYNWAIELKERAFALYRRRGKRVEAAELARWLAFLHGAVHGNMAAANGWMARAERLLEGVDECAAHGWLMLDRAPWSRDSSERERLARAALTIARRFGDTDLEFGSLALLGDAYVHSGRVAEGMTLSRRGDGCGHGRRGRRHPDCGRDLLQAAERLRARGRRQTCGTVDVGGRRLRRLGRVRAPDVPAPLWRDPYRDRRWADAEKELLAAIRTLDAGYRAMRQSPLLGLAELRVFQGRFEEAERLLEDSGPHSAARRLRATVALAQGDLALAEELARVGLEGDDPSDPGCAPLLELLVDVQLAPDDLGAAAETLDRLAGLARNSGHDRVSASAESPRAVCSRPRETSEPPPVSRQP
jgi:tetratricopeptide (TPR) repeat protein